MQSWCRACWSGSEHNGRTCSESNLPSPTSPYQPEENTHPSNSVCVCARAAWVWVCLSSLSDLSLNRTVCLPGLKPTMISSCLVTFTKHWSVNASSESRPFSNPASIASQGECLVVLPVLLRSNAPWICERGEGESCVSGGEDRIRREKGVSKNVSWG